jgi:hypothetical protein
MVPPAEFNAHRQFIIKKVLDKEIYMQYICDVLIKPVPAGSQKLLILRRRMPGKDIPHNVGKKKTGRKGG